MVVGFPAKVQPSIDTLLATAADLHRQRNTMRRAASASGHHMRRASITSAVGARAVCPVLVLRSGAPVPSSGPVVVGISAARSSIMAIAAPGPRTTRDRDVRSGRRPHPGWSAVAVAEALAGQSERYPKVTVQHVLDTAAPIEALTIHRGRAACRRQPASALTPRHRGTRTIARGLLLRSRCPVMVTPSSSERLVGYPRPTPGVPVLPVMSGMAPRW